MGDTPEDMAMEVMVVMEVWVVMGVDFMAKGRLKPSQDILEVIVVLVMDMETVTEALAMDVDSMERGKQMLNPDILEVIIDSPEDMAMVVMAVADMDIMVELS